MDLLLSGCPGSRLAVAGLNFAGSLFVSLPLPRCFLHSWRELNFAVVGRSVSRCCKTKKRDVFRRLRPNASPLRALRRNTSSNSNHVLRKTKKSVTFFDVFRPNAYPLRALRRNTSSNSNHVLRKTKKSVTFFTQRISVESRWKRWVEIRHQSFQSRFPLDSKCHVFRPNASIKRSFSMSLIKRNRKA